jgi:ABC-type transporter Mla subunit MlaD
VRSSSTWSSRRGPHATARRGRRHPQDRSSTAIELETVLDNILPLLRTDRAGEAQRELNAFATALEGRGDQLGARTSSWSTQYFTKLNPELETIKTDIRGLADVSEIYADAAPDLVKMLRNFSVTTRNHRRQAAGLRGLPRRNRRVRDDHAQPAQRQPRTASSAGPGRASDPRGLAKYSPEYPCLLQGIAESNDFIGKSCCQR